MKNKILTLLFLIFRITGLTQTEITIDTPNGGETNQPDEIVTINYTFIQGLAGDDVSFKYSLDNGSTYTK